MWVMQSTAPGELCLMSRVTLPEEQPCVPLGTSERCHCLSDHISHSICTQKLRVCVYTQGHQIAPWICALGMNPSYLWTEHPMVLHICTSSILFFIRISSTWQIHPFFAFHSMCCVFFTWRNGPSSLKSVILSLFQRWMWSRTILPFFPCSH